MALVNFPLVAGSNAPYVVILPWILPVSIVGGWLFAIYLKAKKPDVYDGLSRDLENFDEESEQPVLVTER